MTLEICLDLTARLVGLACLQQTAETIALRRVWSDGGIWSWPILRADVSGAPRGLRWVLDALLSEGGFRAILALRLGAALLAMATGALHTAPVLFGTSLLVALRWRGAFNGGSDAMTLLVLLALTVAHAFETPWVRLGAVFHVGLQAGLSYTVAGIVKLRGRRWRDGTALAEFLTVARYGVPPGGRALAARPGLCRALSWAIILPECLFPAAYASPQLAGPFLMAAAIFHALNVYLFGLNRFLLAWAAAWPSVWFLSQVFGTTTLFAA